jgi:hypothetical protein
MLIRAKFACLSLIACASGMLTIARPQAIAQAGLTVDQIIENNIAARGGLEAWRKIQTMTMTGKLDAGSEKNVQLPFVMKLMKPRLSRLEIEFAGGAAVQVYDGTNGWKVRPFLGRNEVEPYTPAELETAADQQDLDGPFIDHEAKGVKVELARIESVEGHDAYKLKLTMKNGDVRHMWVDAQSFLEVKMEGTPRKIDRKIHQVAVYYRDYRRTSGVMIPFVFETVLENVRRSHKITIEKVVINPPLEENAFVKPSLPGILPVMGFRQSAMTTPTITGATK